MSSTLLKNNQSSGTIPVNHEEVHSLHDPEISEVPDIHIQNYNEIDNATVTENVTEYDYESAIDVSKTAIDETPVCNCSLVSKSKPHRHIKVTDKSTTLYLD